MRHPPPLAAESPPCPFASPSITGPNTGTTSPSGFGPHVVRLRPAPHCRTPVLSYSLKVEPASTSSTGSRIRTATSWRGVVFHKPAERSVGRGRPDRRDDGHQSVRLLPRSRGRVVSRSPTRPTCCKDLMPFLHVSPVMEDSPLAEYVRSDRSHAAARRSTFWSSSTSKLQRRDQVSHPPGAGRAVVRRDAHQAERLVPRLGVAAGQHPAAPGPRRAVRVGLSHSAQGRREAARRPRRRRRTTSPICTPGPKCSCPAPAGSGSTRPRACSPAKGTFRWPARPSRSAPRRSPAPPRSAPTDFEFDMSVTRIHEDPRVTKPYTDEQWDADQRARPAGRRATCTPATCG